MNWSLDNGPSRLRRRKTFLNGMLVWSYEKRLTAEELSNHPFLTKSISEFQKINPSEFENTVEDGNIIVNAKEGLKMK